MLKENKYPNVVCIDCLTEAHNDTNHGNSKINQYYTCYVVKCQVCGCVKECTEPRDFGFPDFEKQYLRIRSRKIQDILDKISKKNINAIGNEKS
jgi:hypothetical protein